MEAKMKIVIVNTSEATGGAAVAAGRLKRALQKLPDVEVKMLVRDKATDDPDVVSLSTSSVSKRMNFLRFAWERFVIFLCNGLNRKTLFQVSIANTGTDISEHPLVREADVIHLHWINQGFLSLKDILKLTRLGKPIVWTMHDMWPCTGICHHARDCEKFQTGCESCFFLSSKGKDCSTKVFGEKMSLYENADMTFVGCSKWIADRARKSCLLKGKKVLSIPNPIDLTVYHPMNQDEARKELALPMGKKLLLFGAVNVTDKRKGIDYLIEGLRKLDAQDVELVVFGQVKDDIRNLFPVPLHSMGYLTDKNKIVALYNAVDMYVTSSLEDNLPNTIMESMACGTPCVGFETGGIPEMIEHKKTGYLARYKDADDFAEGIRWVLTHPTPQGLSDACIEKVRREYSEALVAEKYTALYKELLR